MPPYKINSSHSCLLNPNDPPCDACIKSVSNRVRELMENNGYDVNNRDHYVVILFFYITALKDLASTLQDGIRADMANFMGDGSTYLN